VSGNADDAPRRPTINDVATLAGSSRSTVARALSGEGYVGKAVRERVLAAATELGYVPDAMARSLRKQTSRTIGVLVSNLRDPFYADLASGIGERARRAGFTMILVDDRGSVDEELAAAKVFVGMRAAGVVVTPLSAEVTEYLRSQWVPVVEADRTFSGGVGDTALHDNAGAARRGTDLLIGLGHRRIALLADETSWTTGADRYSGYRLSLTEAGIDFDPTLVSTPRSDVEEARATVVDLLTSPNRPTAVFALNSVLAEGLWRAALDLGMRVPDDLSIISFDDAPWMSMVTPGVTAVAQDAVGLGDAAMSQLLARIDQPDAEPGNVVIDARMRPRGSTAQPPRS
jgi:LacI family transcriptional regulator